MKNKLLKYTGIIAIIYMFITSCDKAVVYEQYFKIPGNTWNNKNIIHFNVNIADTISPHNIYIDIRNRSQYFYSNIFILFFVEKYIF